jgi:tRNA threonylcarbamoyladenosine biosynthesis protein TsaE
MTKLQIETAEQMHELGLNLGAQLRAGDLVLLIGELGAGKTTLTRGIGEALGARGTVQSPTFVLARTHKTSAGPNLTHVDAYRLGSALELDDLDIDFANAIVVIEWPRDFLTGLTESWLEVSIDRSSEDDRRAVSILAHGARWAQTPLEVN